MVDIITLEIKKFKINPIFDPIDDDGRTPLMLATRYGK